MKISILPLIIMAFIPSLVAADGEVVSLKNADFSVSIDRPTFWQISTGTSDAPAGAVLLDEAEFHLASPSVQLVNEDAGQYTSIWQVVDLEPDTNYRLMGWVKGETDDTSTGAGIRLAIADAVSGDVKASSEAKAVSTEWKQVVVPFKTGNEAKIRLILYLHKMSGRAWFDDIELVKE